MPDKITYYAIVGEDRTIDNPYGLARRLEHDDGPSDEALRKDFSWKATPADSAYFRACSCVKPQMWMHDKPTTDATR